MHAAARILKKNRAKTVPSDDPEFFKGDFRLFRPALEPFLLFNVSFRNAQGNVYSLQYSQDGGRTFHYSNISCDDDAEDGAIVSCVGVIDLPGDENGEWKITLITPQNRRTEIGIYRKSRLGLWMLDIRDECFLSTPICDGPVRYALVGGAPKSGTTWVERLLNMHPDVLSTGENNFFCWPDPDEFAAFLSRNPPPYFARAVPQTPPYRTQQASFSAGNATLTLQQLAEISGTCFVADKSPDYSQVLPDILATLPAWKYIHCLRHPLDVAVSRFFHERLLLRNTPQFSRVPYDRALRRYIKNFEPVSEKKGEMFDYPGVLDSLIALGNASQKVFDCLDEAHDRIHIVRYEDLISDFRETTRKLLQFSAVEASDALLNDLTARASFIHFSRGRKAGDENVRDFFRKGIVGDHLNYMTPEQIEKSVDRYADQPMWQVYYPDRGAKLKPTAATIGMGIRAS